MLIVQKYGGTSVGSPEKIKGIARRIQGVHSQGNQVVVVVSAMNDTTDQFTRLAKEITDHPSRREMDMLLTAGERITMALLSMALHELKVDAISFTGSQTGIITDTSHGEATIVDVRPIRVGPELDQGKVVIVAGFQGVSQQKEITTLGRGGSDTTAIALAAGLKADLCEICTDVPGVMTADPRLVPEAQLIETLPWSIMESLAASGGRVMHHRAAAMAAERAVPYRICSTFEQGPGTRVGDVSGDYAGRVWAITGRDPGTNPARVTLVGKELDSEEFIEQAQSVLKKRNIEIMGREPGPNLLHFEVGRSGYTAAVQALHHLYFG